MVRARRPCQTEDLCTLSGHCSDREIGLSLASPGTCVITPLDDNLVQQGCVLGGSSSPLGVTLQARVI